MFSKTELITFQDFEDLVRDNTFLEDDGSLEYEEKSGFWTFDVNIDPDKDEEKHRMRYVLIENEFRNLEYMVRGEKGELTIQQLFKDKEGNLSREEVTSQRKLRMLSKLFRKLLKKKKKL